MAVKSATAAGVVLVLIICFADGARVSSPSSENVIVGEEEILRVNESLLPAESTTTITTAGGIDLMMTESGSGDNPSTVTITTGDNPHLNSSTIIEDDSSSTNNKTMKDVMEDWITYYFGCDPWLPPNHIYFQLANTCFFLSYLAPSGLYGLLYLRLVLAIGSALFAIWGWLILCAFDTFLWNTIFMLINIIHGLVLLCGLRPVRFDKQVEEVYKNIFKPLKVSKQQFKKVVDCMKSIRPLKRGEHFAIERQTKVETLSLLLSGSMLVIENGKTLHVLAAMQFLDSPEWFGVASDDYFQVSIRACEECRVLLWHRDKLKLILLSDPFLQAVFDHILGRDVVRKLTQMKEKISSPGSPYKTLNNGSLDGEKPSSFMLTTTKASVHEHGLVVAPEQMSLLDEKPISDNKKSNKIYVSATASSPMSQSSPTKRYDYSLVQHLDSTDI